MEFNQLRQAIELLKFIQNSISGTRTVRTKVRDMELVSKQVAGLFLLLCILHFAISDESCVFSTKKSLSSKYDFVEYIKDTFQNDSSKCVSCNEIYSSQSKFEANCLQKKSNGDRFYLAAHHLKENQTCALVCSCPDIIKIFKSTYKERFNGEFSGCEKKKLNDVFKNYFCTNDNGASSESEKLNKTISNSSLLAISCPIISFNSSSDSEVKILRAISSILAILLFLQSAYLLKTKSVDCKKPLKNDEKVELIELQATGITTVEVENEEQPAIEEVNENYNTCGGAASTTCQSSPREELCFGKEVIYSDGIQNILDRDFTGPLADSFNIYERISFPDEDPNDE